MSCLGKAGRYRSFPNYIARAKEEHISQGFAWTAQLAQESKGAHRSVLRGIGPRKQSGEFDLVSVLTITVPDDSITPTFAAARLEINNWRWDGVPFLLSAGKGLEEQVAEIRIHFRDVPGNMFCGPGACPDANQLVIRVQPDEAI